MGTSRNLPCSPEPGLSLDNSSLDQQLMPAATCYPRRRGTRNGVLPLTRAARMHLRS